MTRQPKNEAFARTSFLHGANAAYIEDLYEQYLVAPDSVGPKWKQYFDGLKGREAGDVPHSAVIEQIAEAGRQAARGALAAPGAGDERERAVGKLITAYRSRGHLAANLDPLGMAVKPDEPDLALGFHRLSESDLSAEFSTGGVGGKDRMKLGDLVALLKATYTGSIGAEYMHITDVEQRRWMQERMETAGGKYGRSADDKKRILMDKDKKQVHCQTGDVIIKADAGNISISAPTGNMELDANQISVKAKVKLVLSGGTVDIN